MYLDVSRGTRNWSYSSDNARWDSLYIIDAVRLLLRPPMPIDERLEKEDGDDTAWHRSQFVDHWIETNRHQTLCLLKVDIWSLSINLKLFVKDSSDQDWEAEGAKEDEEHTSCD